MHATLRTILRLVLLLGAAVLANASEAGAPALDARGFLYGRITLGNGTVYEGRLRWGEEEAFWGDFFDAAKDGSPYARYVPDNARESVKLFGLPVGIRRSEEETRALAARFGDLRRIEIAGGRLATVLFKSGTRYVVKDGSNDVGSDAKITVWDGRAGEHEVVWKEIRSIDFLPVPAGVTVPVFRLRGTVRTENETFQGFIQWDQDECLSSDELDGRSQGGKVSLPMGDIRSIEQRNGQSVNVVLRNGRTLVVEGTNDVSEGNRGIYVNDPRFGRVLVHWNSFRRVDFDPPGGSGPAYTDFRPGRPLFGKVSTADGNVVRGRLVYDLDEADTMEFLNGWHDNIEYNIPFARIASLLPEKGDATRVVLKEGRELRLDETADVDSDNAGILIFEPGQKAPQYLRWSAVRRIDFEDR
jgi:hypothetical protein